MGKIYPMRITGATLTADAQFDSSAGTLNYQWQRSADGADWTDIVGATDSTYLADQQPRRDRRMVGNRRCGRGLWNAGDQRESRIPVLYLSAGYLKGGQGLPNLC